MIRATQELVSSCRFVALFVGLVADVVGHLVLAQNPEVLLHFETLVVPLTIALVVGSSAVDVSKSMGRSASLGH